MYMAMNPSPLQKPVLARNYKRDEVNNVYTKFVDYSLAFNTQNLLFITLAV